MKEAFQFFKESFSCYDCKKEPFKYFVRVAGRRIHLCEKCVKDYLEARKVDKSIKIYQLKKSVVEKIKQKGRILR